jgi:DNA-binding HxlR family transcriptional regulator
MPSHRLTRQPQRLISRLLVVRAYGRESFSVIDFCTRDQAALGEVLGVLDKFGRRWTGDILIAGMQGARRFREYRRLVDGISDRMLTMRLRELETLGLLSRTVVPTSPVQVFYAPTDHGVTLVRAMRPLLAWGEQRMAKAGPTVVDPAA